MEASRQSPSPGPSLVSIHLGLVLLLPWSRSIPVLIPVHDAPFFCLFLSLLVLLAAACSWRTAGGIRGWLLFFFFFVCCCCCCSRRGHGCGVRSDPSPPLTSCLLMTCRCWLVERTQLGCFSLSVWGDTELYVYVCLLTNRQTNACTAKAEQVRKKKRAKGLSTVCVRDRESAGRYEDEVPTWLCSASVCLGGN